MSTNEPKSTPPPKHEASTKQKVLKVLTAAQRYSAPFLSLFVGIHLAAPIAANFGGSELSTNVMLLGREYYQGKYTEPLLLFIPLGIHIGSSVARRLILRPPKRPALVTLTAWAALLAVPIHINIHRIYPSDPAPPISALSPSELNYEFVKAAFSRWPVFSWVAYGGIASVVLLHAAEGAAIVSRYFTGHGLSKRVRRSVAALAITAVFFGLYKISQEPLRLRGLQLERVNAVYNAFPPHAYLG